MSYFLALSGSLTKFAKPGFLLQSIALLLETRGVELRAIHAIDLPSDGPLTQRRYDQFIAEMVEQVSQASALLLLTPVTKGSSLGLLAELLDLLPDNAFAKRPIALFATGRFAGHVAVIEQALRPVIHRLGATTLAARVHIGTHGWIIVGDERPQLGRGAEREVRDALDLVLRGLALREQGARMIDDSAVIAGKDNKVTV
jgi:FMN reductase